MILHYNDAIYHGGVSIRKSKTNQFVSEKISIDFKTLLTEMTEQKTNIKNESSVQSNAIHKINTLEDIKGIKENLNLIQVKENQTEMEQSITTSNKKVSKVVRVIGNTLFYAVLIFSIATVYLYSDSNHSGRSILGYSYFSVLTSSMQSVIPKGSLVITKQVNPNEIEIGDDITYLVSHDTTFTHRVVDIYENHQDSGMRGFQTQGVNNPEPDKEIVFAGNIVGVVVFHAAGVGSALTYIKHNMWLVLLIFVIILALVINFNTFLKTRKEDRMKISLNKSN